MGDVKQEIEEYKKSLIDGFGLSTLDMQWPTIDTSKPIQELKQQLLEFTFSVSLLINHIYSLQDKHKLSHIPQSIIPWNGIKSGKSVEELKKEMNELFDRIASDLDQAKEFKEPISNVSDLVNYMIIRYQNRDLGLWISMEILDRVDALLGNNQQDMGDLKK